MSAERPTMQQETYSTLRSATDHSFFFRPYSYSATVILIPRLVLSSQSPFIPVGNGKNGCPVNSFLAGQINPEGILCYFWYTFIWKFKQEIRCANSLNLDFVPVDGINDIELDGLNSSAFSPETMDVIKLASKLHWMLVLNAPGFFAIAWGPIKKLIDPRTAAPIQLFANKQKGQKALERFVDKSQLPSDHEGVSPSLSVGFLEEVRHSSLSRQ
jgi:hypothetical protein